MKGSDTSSLILAKKKKLAVSQSLESRLNHISTDGRRPTPSELHPDPAQLHFTPTQKHP